jgi:hypothetical protein
MNYVSWPAGFYLVVNAGVTPEVHDAQFFDRRYRTFAQARHAGVEFVMPNVGAILCASLDFEGRLLAK